MTYLPCRWRRVGPVSSRCTSPRLYPRTPGGVRTLCPRQIPLAKQTRRGYFSSAMKGRGTAYIRLTSTHVDAGGRAAQRFFPTFILWPLFWKCSNKLLHHPKSVSSVDPTHLRFSDKLRYELQRVLGDEETFASMYRAKLPS